MGNNTAASQLDGLLDGGAADRKVMRGLAHASKCRHGYQLNHTKAPAPWHTRPLEATKQDERFTP